MRALVTGGAGFIGSTLVDRLLSEGHDVIALDNLATGNPANLESARANSSFTFVEQDIRSSDTPDVVADLAPEVVFHLAAQIDVRVSVNDPAYDAAVNIIGALHVLEGARKVEGFKKIVFASSGGTIYGDASEDLLPFSEDVKQQPVSPYGISKRAFGDYLHAYGELYGMQSSTLALANVYGPRQNPHGEAGVVAIFAQRILNNEPCTIFGDGKATRDYVYVDDVVDAFVRSATSGSGLYNVGTGVETSTTELHQLLADAAGVDEQPGYAPARTGELQRSSLDSSRLSADTGWTAQVDMAEGTKRVLQFVRDHALTSASAADERAL